MCTSNRKVAEKPKREGTGRTRRALFQGTLFLVLIIVSLPFILPRVIDSDYIRHRVFALLGQELGRGIEADHIAITLFPRPGFRLTGVTLHPGGTAALEIKSALLFPDLGTFFSTAPHPLTGELFLKQITLVKAPPRGAVPPPPLNAVKSGTLKTLAVHFSYTSLQRFFLNIRGAGLHMALETAPTQSITARSFLAEIKKDSELFTADLKPTAFNSPAMTLGVRFHMDGTASQLCFTGENVSVPPLREMASTLLKESAIATTLFHIIKDGFVPHITVNFQNSKDKFLFDPQQMVIKGDIRHGTIAIPATMLLATDVAATVTVENGILSPHLSGAMVESSRLNQGTLQVNLLKKGHPFQGKFFLTANLGELPGILQSLLPDTQLSHELTLTEKIAGSATGTLELARTAGQLSVKVNCTHIDLSGTYQRFPGNTFRLQGDEFSFDKEKITLNGFKGTIGASQLSQVSGTIHLRSPHLLDLCTAGGVFPLKEILSWLTQFKNPMASLLTPLLSSQGTITLDHVSLKGPLLSPEAWTWGVRGSCVGGSVYEDLPGKGISDISLAFDLFPDGFTVKDLTATLHDTAPLMAHFPSLFTSPGLGPLFRDLHTPIFLTNVTLKKKVTLKKNTDLPAFQADITFPGGVSMKVTGNTHQEALTLENLEMDDPPLSSWTMTYHPGAAPMVKGKLSLDTVRKLFKPESPIAEKVTIPGSQGPVFLASGPENGVTLFLGHLDLTTLLHATGQAEDLPADNGINPDNAPPGDKDTKETEQPVTHDGNASTANAPGIFVIPHATLIPRPLVIHADTLEFNDFNSSPFIFRIFPGPEGLDGVIEESQWCGLPVTGEICQGKNALQVTLETDARDVDFTTTLDCLMGDAHLIKGRYDLKASLSSVSPEKGPSPGNFSCRLQGPFELYARNGRIFQMTLLSRVLSLINVSSLLKAKLPDLVQHGFAYDTMIFKGNVSENRISIKKGVINGVDMTLIVSGWIDPIQKTMDLLFFISPLKSVDSLIQKLPIINTMFKGDLISIPITAKGPIHDPVVMALSPMEITKGLFNTLKDILTTPLTLLKKLP